ncbi:THAP domain-containing protein 1 [Biomphalaria glabrata]|nr:THAP domain-containing protein 1 [Biomphalaria glabrata]
MGKQCVAFGCYNNDEKKNECRERKISFHRFPINNPKLCIEWILKIKRTNFTVNKHNVICSEHFEEDCFTYQPFTNRRFIKPGAVPTKFSFSSKCSRRSKKKTMYDLRESVPPKNTMSEDKTKENFGADYTTEKYLNPSYANSSTISNIRTILMSPSKNLGREPASTSTNATDTGGFKQSKTLGLMSKSRPETGIPNIVLMSPINLSDDTANKVLFVWHKPAPKNISSHESEIPHVADKATHFTEELRKEIKKEIQFEDEETSHPCKERSSGRNYVCDKEIKVEIDEQNINSGQTDLPGAVQTPTEETQSLCTDEKLIIGNFETVGKQSSFCLPNPEFVDANMVSRFDCYDHFPAMAKIESGRKCVRNGCGRVSYFFCRKCSEFLCITGTDINDDCFYLYHHR